MNTDKLANNWQNFTQIRLQLKFAFIIQAPLNFALSTKIKHKQLCQ